MSAGVLPEVPQLERPPVDWERHRGDKRPKILPPPGEVWRNPGTGRKVGHRYYTRVTTFADALTEQYNLTQWKLAKLLVGLGQRSDYVRQASALTMEERDRDARDELVAKALEAAGPDAAGLGTALHTLTERLDRGDDIGTPPDEVLPDLAAYTALTEGLIAYRHREARTVCDALECAGTPDGHAYVAEPCPAGCGPEVLHIIDTKTGSIRYPGKMSTQLAIYAHSDLYEPATGERTPVEVCRSWGAIIHLPTETGEAAAFWLDLEHGWRGAEIAGPLREWRKVAADDILRPFSTVQPVKIVDGEVTRIEPRLASTNIKAPPAPGLGDVTELLAESLAARGVQLDDPETMRDEQLDGEPDETSVAEVVHRAIVGDEADRPAATAYGPHVGTPDERGHCTVCGFAEDDPRGEHIDDPLPDRCAHSSGWHRDRATGLPRCPDCGEFRDGEPAPDPEPGRCTELESSNPGAPRCELAAGHTCGHGFTSSPTPVERCVHELRLGECAMPSCRPDLAHLDDSGVEREQLTEWPGVDDVPVEQLASGPDSDAEDELEPLPVRESQIEPARDLAVDEALRDRDDPLVDEILGCVHVRDLELLSSQRWREWQQPHRDLAVERHDQLERAARAAKPVAAFEAAVASASTRAELLEIMNTAAGAEWLTPELEALAGARWAELRVPA